MAGLGDNNGAVAMRTPLYLLISLTGIVMIVATFLPWAGIAGPDGGGDVTSVSGLDAGGWGLAALITGIAIVALGILGYFWNPFDDPEALFVAIFGALVAIGALLKVLDTGSLFELANDFDSVNSGARIGLWLVLLAGADAMLSGLWILYSRPIAERRAMAS